MSESESREKKQTKQKQTEKVFFIFKKVINYFIHEALSDVYTNVLEKKMLSYLQKKILD